MSHEETIRAAYVAANRQDYDALLPLVDPDAELRPILGANLEADVYRGHDGLTRWLDELNGEWERFDADPMEITDGHILRMEAFMDADVAMRAFEAT
jgi:ketosteroid isomerase-like protein